MTHQTPSLKIIYIHQLKEGIQTTTQLAPRYQLTQSMSRHVHAIPKTHSKKYRLTTLQLQQNNNDRGAKLL